MIFPFAPFPFLSLAQGILHVSKAAISLSPPVWPTDRLTLAELPRFSSFCVDIIDSQQPEKRKTQIVHRSVADLIREAGN